MKPQLSKEQRLHFRDEFRNGRETALRDFEGFEYILYALERLGGILTDKGNGLGWKRRPISKLASASPLAEDIPQNWPEVHVGFETLFNQFRIARNDAIHEGAFARHLTTHAVLVSIIIEDALMTGMDRIGDYMIRMPLCACAWHPLSFVRQMLLSNSFSYLPVEVSEDNRRRWKLISDCALAIYLRSGDRRQLLASTLDVAVKNGLELEEPFVCGPDTSIQTALNKCRRLPVLIVSQANQQLLGLATPFDLL